jgi:phosphoadenosine phosphosulfate reductase
MRLTHEVQAQDEVRARQANRDLAAASPGEILAWALHTFGDAFCITTSLADAVLVDMASRIQTDVHVMFLDTGYHFEETLRTRSELVSRYPVHLVTAVPERTVTEQDAEHGPALFRRNPDLCCQLRKVNPLNEALSGYRAWASGIRRDETSSRRHVGVVDWDATRSMVKVNPLANWTQEQVQEYVVANDVLMNPLLYEGYPSIGCAPCTRPVLPGADARSGRWVGRSKTECGLHTV